MKVRAMKDEAPLTLNPGDSIKLTYREVCDTTGRTVTQEVLEEVVTEPLTVDRCAVVELDKGEAKQLGMKKGALAGVFGKRAS